MLDQLYPLRSHLFLFALLLLALSSWSNAASSSSSRETFKNHLHKKDSTARPQTRNPAALFILPSTATNFSDLSIGNLAIVSNSFTEEDPSLFSQSVIDSFGGAVWVQDFNFTYSNALDVVDGHAAAALISLLVASGTGHCTSGLCVRDVTEAWTRGAIERGCVLSL
jgi:hypothetical protein